MHRESVAGNGDREEEGEAIRAQAAGGPLALDMRTGGGCTVPSNREKERMVGQFQHLNLLCKRKVICFTRCIPNA
jgi:hypothetical protein